jgi:hypothetical protein
MKRTPDSTPVAELTVGQLRATLREAIEHYARNSGSEADAKVSSVESEVEELRREVDDLGAYLEENIDFAYKVYAWFQAGMPEDGAAELSLLARKTGVARRLDRYARKALELREPDGTWPTQDAVADALGITTRALRDGRIGGWAAILSRADGLKGPEPTA